MNRWHVILIVSALLFGLLAGYSQRQGDVDAAQREYFYKGLAVFCLRAPSPTVQGARVYTVAQCEDLYQQAVQVDWYTQVLNSPPFITTPTP